MWNAGGVRRVAAVGCVSACLGQLGGCQAWTAFEPEQVAQTHPFLAVAATGREVLLGDASSWGMADEKPVGRVRFGHDYVLDRTEVTRGEFRDRMGWVSESRGEGLPAQVDDSLPAQSLTWFDAVLFCNARSRAQGLDTVYAWSLRKQDARGSTWDLQGLSADLSKDGWRLPTEAEWEFAARAGSTTSWEWGNDPDSVRAGQRAWYQGNSGGVVHRVATREPNSWGLHDMAGNVMEWVHDWKGPFPDSSTDYAGSQAPGALGDKPVKGGAYAFGLRNLRPSSRSATYPALPGSSAPYVGFRCARGAIPRATFGLPGGGIGSTLPQVSWDLAGIASALEGRTARVVFVQPMAGKRVLCWAEFGPSGPVVRQLGNDPDPVFHPVISPDGKWVAWSTVLEGSTRQGRIKVRKLSATDTAQAVWEGSGAIPRWWVRPGTRDTFLVVASSGSDNAGSSWGGHSTRLVAFAGGRFGADSVLTLAGAYHDGRTADGRELVSGSTRLRRIDLRDGSDRVQFTGPANGKRAGDTSQMCNVSVAPDATGDVLGLDFGAASSTVVGRPYGIHEVAFRLRPDGTVRSFHVVPVGEASFEDLEWTNDPRFAVASTLDGQGRRHRLWMLDLESGRTTRLASGLDLWQPGLWMEPEDPWIAATGDSAGAYNTPALDVSTEDLANKLVRFWALRDSIEVVALGSSRTRFGFAPSTIRSFRAFNLSAVGGPLDLSDTLLTHYVLPHAPRLRAVVLELDIGWMFWRNCSGVCALFQKTDGLVFDRNHGYWADSLPDGILSRIVRRSWPSSGEYDPWGGIRPVGNGWGEDISNDWSVFVTTPMDTTSYGFRRSMRQLETMLDTLARRGVRVLAVNYPQSPLYASSEWSGRHEPGWDLHRKAMDRIAGLASRHANFRLLDAYADGRHDYVDADAYDYDHLSERGAAKLGARIDSALAGWR